MLSAQYSWNKNLCLQIFIKSCRIDYMSCHHCSWLIVHPDSKVHGTNTGPIWGRQDPGEPHVGPMNLAIWACIHHRLAFCEEWHCRSLNLCNHHLQMISLDHISYTISVMCCNQLCNYSEMHQATFILSIYTKFTTKWCHVTIYCCLWWVFSQIDCTKSTGDRWIPLTKG